MSLRESSGRAITADDLGVAPAVIDSAEGKGDKRADLIDGYWAFLKEDSWGADGESQTHAHLNPCGTPNPHIESPTLHPHIPAAAGAMCMAQHTHGLYFCTAVGARGEGGGGGGGEWPAPEGVA